MANGKEFDCIVLGAGMAGVTAARDLRRSGYKVLLLEGSSHIGGRMLSRRDFIKNPGFDPSTHPVEAGAEFVHVTMESYSVYRPKKPPLLKKGRYREFWDELTDLGYVPREFAKYGVGGHNRLFIPGWEKPKDPVSAVLEDREICKVKSVFDKIRDFKAGKSPESAGAFVNALTFLPSGNMVARYTLSAHTPGILNESLDTISVFGLMVDRIADQLEEKSEYQLKDNRRTMVGYDHLPNKIAKQFTSDNGSEPGPAGVIKTLHKVMRVARLVDDTLQVNAEDEHGQLQTFVAAAVVSTFSVGVLNPDTGKGHDIFGTLLTADKREALSSVKMGAITKFSLEFKTCVWNDPQMTVLSNPAGKGRTFFSSFPGATNGPFVLTGLLMGEDHRWISSISDDRVAAEGLLRELEKIFNPNWATPGKQWAMDKVLYGTGQGAAFMPNFHRQEWSEKNSFTMGANSYISVNPASTIPVPQLRETLKSPLETLPLFWAGEATAPAYHRDYQPLAVHGAYISGVEVAKDVAQFLGTGRSATKFKAYYRKKYQGIAIVPPVEPAPRAVRLKLTEDETRALRAFARHQPKRDLNAAASDLVGKTVRMVLNDDGPDKGLPKLAANQGQRTKSRALSKGVPATGTLPRAAQSEKPHPIQFRLTKEQHRRLEVYARRHHRGDYNRAAHAILSQVMALQAERSGTNNG